MLSLDVNAWDSFNHDVAHSELMAIVDETRSLGARPGSYGARKLTLEWPDGRTIHIKRFLEGRFRWLVFTDNGCRAVLLAHRDPNLHELRHAVSH